ncbi:MAG: helix-turn-helix domain-containing protein [Nanoarchaeota archaeon]|nr:helix-turn-helix domain-containing protein [Nanoarchaeota archaeon]
MAKKSFLLVSLQENKAKELATVISNDSCRKILDYLAEKEDATESEISEKLGIPISTVHYNLKNLIKAGIIEVEEFHYSKKGKEVNHYKLANKYIIIAPKTTHGIKEKLRSILPVSLFALAGAGLIQLYTNYFLPGKGKIMQAAAPTMMKVFDEGGIPEAEVMESGASEGARAVMEKVPEVLPQVMQQAPNYALWFLLGCVFVIVLVIIFELIKAKKANKDG